MGVNAMNKNKKITEQPFFLPLICFLLGMVFGLVALGWWIWPVKWVDASPAQLQNEYKRDYLCMVIDSYVRNFDENLVDKRLFYLGEDTEEYIKQLSPDLCKFTSKVEIENFITLKFPEITSESGAATEEETLVVNDEQPEEKRSLVPVFLFVGMIVAAGSVFAYYLYKRGKIHIGKPKQVVRNGFVEEDSPSKNKGFSSQEPALAQYMTTYRIGDDLYDESFSIDSSTGEFLGECGVGITETIGVGDPKKVNALEIWLFDKNDIQTVTKVLMSEHSFNDPASRQRLAAKGETMLVENGQQFTMETATLQLEARVVDMVYEHGPLPENSHFSRLTLEISVWNK
jgi:hypothetical protein